MSVELNPQLLQMPVSVPFVYALSATYLFCVNKKSKPVKSCGKMSSMHGTVQKCV